MRAEGGGDPVYAPNTRGGPAADPAKELPAWMVDAGEMVRDAYTLRKDDDDFGQPGTLWREVLPGADKDGLVTNIVGHAGNPDVTPEMQDRVVRYWTQVDSELGARVAAGLGRENGAGAGEAESAESVSSG